MFLFVSLSFVGISAAISQDSTDVDLTTADFLFIDDAQLDSGEVFTFWGLYFALGSEELIDSSNSDYQNEITAELLQSIEARLVAIACTTYIIEVGVHKDCRGSASSSRELTPRRALAIVE